MPLTVEHRGAKKAIPGTPATSLADIFMQACAAFKVDAAVHALRHKKRELDLTLPLRLANLPAGSVAELCELDAIDAAKRTVTVALQQSDGSRSQGTFACTVSLWDLLAQFEDLSGARLISNCAQGEMPCVEFMNSVKLTGKGELLASSLLRLGVVSGSALLRHSLVVSETHPVGEQEDATTAAPSEEDTAREAMPTGEVAAHSGTPIPREAEASEEMEVEHAPHLSGEKKDEARETGRKWEVGRPRDDGTASQTMMEIDDELFEFTAADFHQLEKEKKAKESEPAFKTRKMREMEKEARLAAFKTIAVRFVFPNQHWIQARFNANETLQDLYQFVRGQLVQKERAFVLTTTPPPIKLAEAADLLKHTNLVPSAKVYFSWTLPPLDGPYLTFQHVSEIMRLEAEQNSKAPEENGKADDVEDPPSAAALTGNADAKEEGGKEMDKKDETVVPFSGEGKQLMDGGTTRAGEPASPQSAKFAAEKRALGKPKWFKMAS